MDAGGRGLGTIEDGGFGEIGVEAAEQRAVVRFSEVGRGQRLVAKKGAVGTSLQAQPCSSSDICERLALSRTTQAGIVSRVAAMVRTN